MAFRNRLPYGTVAWCLVLAALGVFAGTAAVVSLPINFGWPVSVQWLARSLVGAGVLLGVLGTLTGESVVSVGRRLRAWLNRKSRAVQAGAAGVFALLLAAALAVPAGLIWRDDPAVVPAPLRAAVEMGLGDSAAPWRIHQDSTGAFWFIDDQDMQSSDEMGRITRDLTNITVRPPADELEPDEKVLIQDFTTVGSDAWVLLTGLQDRILVFGGTGRLKDVLPIAGAKAIERDGRGHVWVATLTG